MQSQPVKKSFTSSIVASKDKLPRWTVKGGLSGRGISSRIEYPVIRGALALEVRIYS
jgi:hypothetical protein